MSGNSLKNKVIIVTGGSGGIGNAIVNKLSSHDANIISVYHTTTPKHSSHRNVISYKANLTVSNEWDSLLSFTQNKFGKFDVLINCAGVLEPGDFISLDENQIEKMIVTNFSSVVTGTQKALKLMKDYGSGHIINIGSLGGIVPMPYSAVYSATKFAIRGFTFSLLQELKDSGIKLSLITPGAVDTKMLYNESRDQNTAISFVSESINPAEVADTVLRVISKPKFEIILPREQALSSKMITYSPFLFSKFYKLIHKVGLINKRAYYKTHNDFLTAKGALS